MAEDSKTTAADSPKAASSKATPKASAKKEKPPAIEEKPFEEFIQNHYLPSLASALEEAGLAETSLNFQETPLGIHQGGTEAYWQVQGQLPMGQRQFSVVFTQGDIKGPKFFYCAEGSDRASTLEPFMGDERRITLDLMVLYVLQRLNGQKWLARN